VAVHSFAPAVAGRVRHLDVALLYDPGRPRERTLARAWKETLRELDPTLRVRRNHPYRGAADGLTTWLRRRFPDARYAGLELEVGQALLAGPRRRELGALLAESLARLLAPRPPGPRAG
jgi:predicted N-formylglutamate amidohydrolase